MTKGIGKLFVFRFCFYKFYGRVKTSETGYLSFGVVVSAKKPTAKAQRKKNILTVKVEKIRVPFKKALRRLVFKLFEPLFEQSGLPFVHTFYLAVI